MSTPAAPTSQRGAARDHGFHTLRIRRVIAETAEASSFVLDVPADLRESYRYEAGQFVTVRVRIDDRTHHRCYSMSSAPAVDDELTVTVKRVPGGVVSNWMVDSLAAGDAVDASVPAGVFTLPSRDDRDRVGDVVGFGAGSGITPLMSIVKTALATTDRRVRLYYANRDRDTTIFRAELDGLAAQHPDRLEVVHHLDVERGFVDGDAVRAFLAAGAVGVTGADTADDHFVCGPAPFMDIVEEALLGSGVDADRIHIERFTPAEPSPPAGDAADATPADTDGDTDGGDTTTRITIELDGHTGTADHHPGATILQTARQLGMSPPYSCESGSCATCMAKLVEGTVKMHVNDVLEDDEVEDGWVLTCQSVPTSTTVHVAYEGS